MRRRRDQADVALPFPAAPVVLADGEQPRELALRAGVGLQRHGLVPGDLAQPRLELREQLQVALGLLERGERVETRELGPGDREHLARRVELHRARPERDHRPVEREVAIGEATQVPQHLGLRAVAMEDGMCEVLGPASQLVRDEARRVLVEGGD